MEEEQPSEPELILAIKKREFEDAKTLINAGCIVNIWDVGGMTPLHCAAREARADLVELLLEAGADANAITFMMRKPGGDCPLANLAEASHRNLPWDQILSTAQLFVRRMHYTTFARKTTTGITL